MSYAKDGSKHGVHPNSLEASRDQEIRKKIREARRRYSADRFRLERWYRGGMVSWGNEPIEDTYEEGRES